MRSVLKFAQTTAMAVAVLAAAPAAFAQTAPAEATQAAPAAAAAVTVGLPVKDNTGAVIGSITEVKPDATGAKQMATIKMGEDTFAVDTAMVAVRDGAVLINATQAELKAMLKK